MKRVNPIKLENAFAGLKMRFPNGITTARLKDELSRLGISLSPSWQSAFRKAGVLIKLRKGEVTIHPDLNNIVQACNIHYNEYKSSRKESIKVSVFNKEVEHSISIEEAKLFLEKKGWFVYKPSKGESVTIQKTLNF